MRVLYTYSDECLALVQSNTNRNAFVFLGVARNMSVLRKEIFSHENITSTNREQCKAEPIKIRRHGFIIMLLFCYFHIIHLY